MISTLGWILKNFRVHIFRGSISILNCHSKEWIWITSLLCQARSIRTERLASHFCSGRLRKNVFMPKFCRYFQDCSHQATVRWLLHLKHETSGSKSMNKSHIPSNPENNPYVYACIQVKANDKRVRRFGNILAPLSRETKLNMRFQK